jgi:hypothetical protein
LSDAIRDAANAAALAAAKLCAAPAVPLHHLTDTKLSAICAPVAVGIGIIVAYLTLDRFRYHTRILDLIKSLNSVIKTPPDLLTNLEEGKPLNQIEKNILAIHCMCGNDAVWERAKNHKDDIFDGGLDTALHFLLWILTKTRLDRWLSLLVCMYLCLWEIIVSYILFTSDDPPQWLGAGWSIVLSFGTTLVAYAIPLLAFSIGELTIGMVRASVKRWTGEENTRQQQAAAGANIPNLPQVHTP